MGSGFVVPLEVSINKSDFPILVNEFPSTDYPMVAVDLGDNEKVQKHRDRGVKDLEVCVLATSVE